MNDFDAVGAFHQKFDLPNATHHKPKPRVIDPSLRDFRLKFILEELEELCEGYGLELNWSLKPMKIPAVATGGCPRCGYNGQNYYDARNHSCMNYGNQDLVKIADALVDLSYVILGTAHVHGLPWEKLFAEVQRANITKERCGIDHRFQQGPDPKNDGCDFHLDESTVCGKVKSAHSLRGSAYDVIKPEDWSPPDIISVLMAAGWPGPPLPLERG